MLSYSNGIDSTGVLYWVIKHFPKEMIYLIYCDTDCEYPENIALFYKTAKFLNINPVLLSDPRGFLGLLLHERLKFPDMKRRWCTGYLKIAITDKWIRQHRAQLGNKCLFLSGERRDESTGREKLPELEYHSTTLRTKRLGDFICHWYRPCLDYQQGKMFEQGKELHLETHPCYEYIGKCSCMFCMFMPDRHATNNIKRYPKIAAEYVRAEIKLQNTWKKARSLQSLFNECLDIDDIDEDLQEEYRQLNLFEMLDI